MSSYTYDAHTAHIIKYHSLKACENAISSFYHNNAYLHTIRTGLVIHYTITQKVMCTLPSDSRMKLNNHERYHYISQHSHTKAWHTSMLKHNNIIHTQFFTTYSTHISNHLNTYIISPQKNWFGSP
jgi:hypothetical protein